MTSGNNNVSLDEQKNTQKRSNKKLNIFLICLIIATIMWLMIRLSRDYTQTAVFSIYYKGIQKNKILIPSSDTFLITSIQTSGYNIIYRSLFPEQYKLQIDLAQYTPKLNGDFFEINIETSSLINKLSAFFRTKEKIISVLPSNLKIKLEKAYSKKVPVKVDVDISYAKQYSLYKNIYIEPDSVYITGNKKLIDTLKFVKTEKKVLNDLSSNTYLSLKLINPLNSFNLRYSAEQVKMYIPVAQYTEESVEVPLSFDSVPPNMQLIAYPDKVNLFFIVSIPDYKKISVDSFKVGLNEAELFHSKNNIAKVIIKKVPAFAKIQRVEPDNIEYLIRKK